MSLYGMMRTSASGMAAQANRLGTVADNIANSSTTGYKRASAEFSSFVLETAGTEYQPGSVETTTRRAISKQGGFDYTTSGTDLAVKGEGFFVVAGTDGQPVLTRAGNFVKDSAGNLVNAAGYRLLGYDVSAGGGTGVANGFAGLVPISMGALALQANPSQAGTLFLNLPSAAPVTLAANLPAANAATAEFAGKTSLVAYDALGNAVTLDVYSAKTAANTWQIAVYDRAAAGPAGFPYSAPALTTASLSFDGATGQLTPASPQALTIAVPGGSTLTLDVGQSSQFATDYTVLEATVDGNTPSEVDRIEIGGSGELYAIYETGSRVLSYRVPLATVVSTDNLKPLAGNAYAPSIDSGDVQVGTASAGGLGMIVSGALEKSTVDLASELTIMIEAQRNYTANSKVFQTGAELLDVLVNLKR